MVEKENKLRGQRPALKTKSAKRIRSRMIEDVKSGAVLPPIVLGVAIDEKSMEEINKSPKKTLEKEMENIIHKDNLSIIDGIQRTEALLNAFKKEELESEKEIRVEYWISSSLNSLLYRMLVLNTGQIPWKLARQLEVIFHELIIELENNISKLNLIKRDNNSRRSQPGEYQAHQFIRLYFHFGVRKENLDIEDKIAEEFAKLDLIQATSNKEFTQFFEKIVSLLVEFDYVFSKSKKNSNLKNYKEGKKIFTNNSARVGFIVACAQEIMGRPGIDRGEKEQLKKFKNLNENAKDLIEKIEDMDDDDVYNFLDIETLDEIMMENRPERKYFLKAFKVLIDENFELEKLTPCWRAY